MLVPIELPSFPERNAEKVFKSDDGSAGGAGCLKYFNICMMEHRQSHKNSAESVGVPLLGEWYRKCFQLVTGHRAPDKAAEVLQNLMTFTDPTRTYS